MEMLSASPFRMGSWAVPEDGKVPSMSRNDPLRRGRDCERPRSLACHSDASEMLIAVDLAGVRRCRFHRQGVR